MASFVDITGETFGRLTALFPVRGGERISWQCRCECGNSHVVSSVCLRRGSARSCGCLNAERVKAVRDTAVDMTGQVFNHLTVLRRAPLKHSRKIAYWGCLCSCGKVTDVRRDHLLNGNIKSCGCKSVPRCKTSEERVSRRKATLTKFHEKLRADAERMSRKQIANAAWKEANRTRVNKLQQKGVCPVCKGVMRKSSTMCKRCILCAQWVFSIGLMPSIEQLKEFSVIIKWEDVNKWQEMRTKRQTQALRKRLVKTLQYQITESQPGPLDS